MATADQLSSAGAVAVWIVIGGTASWVVLRLRKARRQTRGHMFTASADRNEGRNYPAFLRAICDVPGNGWQAMSAAAFAGALALDHGVGYATVVVAGTLVVIATLGYLGGADGGPEQRHRRGRCGATSLPL